MVAIVYGRASTSRQEREGMSIPEQIRLGRERAVSLGAAEIIEITDAVSGATLDRPGLNKAREIIASGVVGLFICLDPDRLARDLMLQLVVTDEIERAGVKMVFVQHNYESTPEGQMFYQFRGAISQFERAKIQERTLRGRAAKLRAGRRVQGRLAYGYAPVVGAPGQVQVVEDEAAAVRFIFEQAASGVAYQRIAEELNARRVKPQRGIKWHGTTVAKMIRNTVYVGRQVCNRYGRFKGDTVIVPFPPIIDQALFDKATAVVSRRRRQTGRRGRYMLSGLCVCGSCGGAMFYDTSGSRKPDAKYLRCINHFRNQTECFGRAPKVSVVEQYIWNVVGELLLSSEAHKQRLLKQLQTGGDNELARLKRDRRVVEKELSAAQQEQVTTVSLLARGQIDQSVADMILSDTQGRISRLKESLLKADAEVSRIEGTIARREEVIRSVEAFRRELERQHSLIERFLATATDQQRQAVTRKLIEKVVLLDGQDPQIVYRVL